MFKLSSLLYTLWTFFYVLGVTDARAASFKFAEPVIQRKIPWVIKYRFDRLNIPPNVNTGCSVWKS